MQQSPWTSVPASLLASLDVAGDARLALAGWKGRGCTEMAKRPCSNHYRATGSEPAMQPGRWSIPGWLANRYPDDSASSVAERLEMLGA